MRNNVFGILQKFTQKWGDVNSRGGFESALKINMHCKLQKPSNALFFNAEIKHLLNDTNFNSTIEISSINPVHHFIQKISY